MSSVLLTGSTYICDTFRCFFFVSQETWTIFSETEATFSGKHITCKKKSQFCYRGSIGNVLERHSIPAHGVSNGRRTTNKICWHNELFQTAQILKLKLINVLRFQNKRRFTFEPSKSCRSCETYSDIIENSWPTSII